ncbi:unnamed protein product [Clavelina lepadiformis]|uniref:Uncharacterized protein n=1 Tax=Clavelina lepadiformis TaxID=159417 RepID=A0ABP0GAE2_CLALP
MKERTDTEEAKRIQVGRSAWKTITWIMCDKKVQEKLNRKMYMSTIRPVIFCGMEAVVVTRTVYKRARYAGDSDENVEMTIGFDKDRQIKK